LVLPAANLDCGSDLVWRVLADATSNEALKNDITNFIEWYDKVGIVSAKVSLVESDGTKTNLTGLSTYGTAYDYGFDIMPGVNSNGNGEKAIGYYIEWKKVLATKGEGLYYLEFEGTTLFGATTTKKTPSFCLKQYSVERADGTVRIEYYLNGILGDVGNELKSINADAFTFPNSIVGGVAVLMKSNLTCGFPVIGINQVSASGAYLLDILRLP